MAFGIEDAVFYHVYRDDMHEGGTREYSFSIHDYSREDDDEVFDIRELDPYPDEHAETVNQYYEQWEGAEIAKKHGLEPRHVKRLCWKVMQGDFADHEN